jgi:hypothetical protein
LLGFQTNLVYEVQDEDLALQAMQVAEEKIKYNKKKKQKRYIKKSKKEKAFGSITLKAN